MTNTTMFPNNGNHNSNHMEFSQFTKRLRSVISYIMNRNVLFFAAAVILVALAACGKGEEETAAIEKEQAATATQLPAEEGAEKNGPNLVETLRANAGVLTPEQKAQIVDRARSNAEVAARAVGQTDEQATAAGSAAGAAAQRSIDARQP